MTIAAKAASTPGRTSASGRGGWVSLRMTAWSGSLASNGYAPETVL